MKQTAVDWLIEQIIKYRLVPEETNPDNVLFHKAKAMEKQQIKDAWLNSLTKGDYNSAEEYYNETFK